MNNTPPDKPGLYWARHDKSLHLVKVVGVAPFLRAQATNVSRFASYPFTVIYDKPESWQWLGEANAPKEDGT